MIAKEKGLEPLANLILLQMTKEPLEKEAEAFINEEKDVKTVEDALKGANDIIAEHIADDAEYRTWIRKATWDHGKITSSAKKPEESSVFEMYYDFEEPIEKIAGYRILAINRGEKEGILQVKIEPDMQKIASYLARKIITRKNPYTTKALFAAIEDSYKRLIAPSIERDIRNELTENDKYRSDQSLWKELSTTSHAATDRRTGRPWMGPCISYWMQISSGRCNRKSIRYSRHLSDSTTE